MSEPEDQLNKVFWLGGSSCSGKSLISEILSRQSAGQLHSHFLLSSDSHQPSGSLSGMKMTYDDFGNGLAAVLLHGYPFDRSMWCGQLY